MPDLRAPPLRGLPRLSRHLPLTMWMWAGIAAPNGVNYDCGPLGFDAMIVSPPIDAGRLWLGTS